MTTTGTMTETIVADLSAGYSPPCELFLKHGVNCLSIAAWMVVGGGRVAAAL